MKVVFRVDASVAIGTGHVMRCLTLAEELREQGNAITFVSRELPGNLCDFVMTKGFQLFRISYGELFDTSLDAARTTMCMTGTPDWLIVDHYGINAEWERLLRPMVRRIMVIDDLATLNTGLWTLVNPVGDGSYAITGSHVLLTAAGGANHDPAYGGTNNSVRLLQTVANVDFQAEVKFESKPTQKYQMQGVLVEQNATNYLRFEVSSNGSATNLARDEADQRRGDGVAVDSHYAAGHRRLAARAEGGIDVDADLVVQRARRSTRVRPLRRR